MKNVIFFFAKIFFACMVCSVIFYCAYDGIYVNGLRSSDHMTQDLKDDIDEDKASFKKQGFTSVNVVNKIHALKTKNHDDAAFAKYYNTTCSKDRELPIDDENFGGTCWATAATSVLEYYGAKPKAKYIYTQVVKQGVDDFGKNVVWRGLKSCYMDDLLNKMFSNFFQIEKKADQYVDSTKLYKNVKSNYSSHQIGILCGTDHAMCASGYATIDYTFKDKNKKQQKRHFDYIVINWGVFGDDDDQQFFQIKYINGKCSYVKVSNK